jgi:hypothetical protein
MAKMAVLNLDNGIPTLAAVSPPYAALLERREKIWAQQRTLRDQLTAARGETASPDPAEKDSEKARRVAELLGEPAAPAKPVKKHAETIGRVKAEQEAVEEALRQIEVRIRAERLVASDTICDMIAEQMRGRTYDVINATLALHKANVALTAMAEDLNGKDIAWSCLNPIFPAFADDPRQIRGGLAQFLHEAVELGWIDKGKLPLEFGGRG